MPLPQKSSSPETALQRAALDVLRKYERRMNVIRAESKLQISLGAYEDAGELFEALEFLIPDIKVAAPAIIAARPVPSENVWQEWRFPDVNTFVKFCEFLNTAGIDLHGNPREAPGPAFP